MGTVMKILVAEDDKVSRLLLVRTLEKQGYRVLSAEDGVEGWKIFEEEKEEIQIAILDWNMPRMNGLELCRKIRESHGIHYVYVMFLTGKTDVEDIVQGLETGADDYLTKPFDKRELLSRLNVGMRIVELESTLKEANKKLHYLAITDGLTAVFNRRALLERLGDELSRASREKQHFCLAMLDIDHFKSVNDNYGHRAGDKILVGIVDRIKSQLRPYDIMGRYGGEEFLLGIINSDPGTSKEVAERICTSISRRPFELEGKKLNVSVSIGTVSVIPPQEPQEDDIIGLLDLMIRAADDALYEAKDTGRNKVVSAKPLCV